MAKKKIDFGFTPSVYQQKVFDFVEHGNGNAVISALAGAGKTSTIVACMKLVPSTQKCLFLAFNKSIVEALSEKVKNNSNCHVKTMHSLGYLMIRRNLGMDIKIDEYKYNTYVKKNIADLTTIEDVKLTRPQVSDYIGRILALIDFSRSNLAQSEREIIDVAKTYSVPILYDEPLVVQKCLRWGSENYDTIDYTDMVWLPYEMSLSPTGLKYDWVLFDEAQDASKAYIKLFLKCLKRGGRFIAVGDEKQMINAFAGSSPEAFSFMCNYPNTQVFELPVTYRCPVSVVEMAKKDYVPNMLPRDDAPEGLIIHNCKLSVLKGGDMVLARAKGPLLKLYVKLLKRGIKCYVKGKDIGLNLIRILEDINKDELNVKLDKDGVFVRLYDNLFDERNKMMLKYGITKDDATLSSAILSKYDSINCLTTLAYNVTDKEELIDKINKVFQEDKDSIVLSTIHKAKGLEADNVYILCYDHMPSQRPALQAWEVQQEKNLVYVAITRAKHTLGMIAESEIPPCGSAQESDDILSELSYIEKKVCRLLGKEIIEDTDNIELSRINVRHAEDLSKVVHGSKEEVVRINEPQSAEPDNDVMSMLSQYLSDDDDKNQLKQFLS